MLGIEPSSDFVVPGSTCRDVATATGLERALVRVAASSAMDGLFNLVTGAKYKDEGATR